MENIFKIVNLVDCPPLWTEKEIDFPQEEFAEKLFLKSVTPLIYWCIEKEGSGVGSIIYKHRGHSDRWYFEGINYSAGQNPLHDFGYALNEEEGYDTLDQLYTTCEPPLRPEIRKMVAELKSKGFI